MKLRVINIIELILGLIFIICYFLTKINGSDLAWLATIFGLLLVLLYFPFGFYTLKSPGIHIANLIIYGMSFSMAVFSILFSLMGIDISIILLIIMIGWLFSIACFRAFAVYLFNMPKIFDYNNGIAIRYLILFAILAYAIVTYKFSP